MSYSRNRTADLLKGIAVLLMVQVHIIELFAQQSIYDSFAGSILLFLGGPPAAPIFMTVMGYFIASGNSKLSTSILRGLKLIGAGLLLNFGLNFHLFIKIYNETIVTSPWPYLFGVDILFLAGLSIIILAIMQKVAKQKIVPYILLVVIIFLIPKLLPYPESAGTMSYVTALFYSESWWSYFPIIPWLVYPLTGFLFYIIEPYLTDLIKKRISTILLLSISGVILVFTISYGIKTASKLHIYYHHNYIYYLFTLNFMIFWSVLCMIITSFSSNHISQFIEWMGKNVTVFYVIQWLLIGNIATGIYKTQSGIQVTIWFIVILIITSFLTFLWIKFRSKQISN